ncbi:MAG: hypothetical protein IJQ81_08930 [Oscillibacter sp.]|nr:hypothetical protein [Oscillibacter sp.]
MRLVLSYSWEALRGKSGLEQYGYYKDILRLFGKHCTGRVREIYQGAATNIDEPKNLAKIISSIDALRGFARILRRNDRKTRNLTDKSQETGDVQDERKRARRGVGRLGDAGGGDW